METVKVLAQKKDSWSEVRQGLAMFSDDFLADGVEDSEKLLGFVKS